MIYSIGGMKEVDYYEEQHRKDVFCAPHIHHHFEFLYILEGTVDVIIEGKTYILNKNEAAMMMPYEIHEFKTKESSDVFVIGFPAKYISEHKKEFEGKTLKNPVMKIGSVFREMLNEFVKSAEHDIFQRKSIIYKSISAILKDNELIKSSALQSDTFREAILYIMENFKEEITLKKTAEFLGITPVHLSRMFSKKGGKTYSETVNIVRLHEASSLLMNTDLSIGEIAYQAGFGSIRNFNRIFEKYYKCTPRIVRNADNAMEILGKF